MDKLHAWIEWASDAQKPPAGDWLIWLFMGGRGAGKTRAGAEWVRAQIIAGRRRVALVGPALADTREVMIDGESGLLRLGPPDQRPRYEASRRRLVWPCGAIAQAFSAEDPDSLRGPQFEIAWCDEFAAWPDPQKALDTLRMAVRLGRQPRIMITTTPRPVPALKNLRAAPGVVETQQPTVKNADNLAPGFVAAMQAAYGDSALGRQELDGELIDDPEGALWQRPALEACVMTAPDVAERIIIALDPPASGGAQSAECGIVVASACGEGIGRTACVLADLSFGPAAPADWARRAAEAFETFKADAVVAEANQGGEMVRSVLQAEHAGLPVKLVHASRGKRARAEPVAALYAAGRVRHAGHFPALVDQMCAFGAPETVSRSSAKSPDRVDALVWAITELLLQRRRSPRLRPL
ncbi:terminase family protein [Maricaulis sp.]|uniref:DNA-packaging protein n=1 Tax=Maricaulis sp. TaxID=1486257 RepID=UPI003439B7AD